MTKILFIHNTAMWYRRPFFKLLSQIYEMTLIFTHIDISKKIYGITLKSPIEGLNGVNYFILKNYFGVAIGVIKFALRKHDLIVGGSWDSDAETLETIFCILIAKLKRIPFILYREDWDWVAFFNRKKRHILFIKIITNFSDAILVPGYKHKELFEKLGVNRKRIFIVPNVSSIAINRSDFLKSEQLKEELNLKNKKIILYVGRLVKYKGVEYLIKSLSNLISIDQNIVLLIVGYGPEKENLLNLAKHLKCEKNILFIGKLDNNRITPYYLLSDVCVIPTISYRNFADPWVFVVNEAMSCGKPIIATDAVGAAFDMVKNNINGYIIKEKKVDELSASIKKIIFNSRLANTMGKESKKIIEENYQYKNMVDGFNKAINYVLEI